MSQENVEVVRRLYEAMLSQDLEAAAALTHPEAEWISDHRVGDAPVRGRENVIRFFTDRAEMFDDLRIEIERVSETGERVLVFLRLTGTGRASGAAFEIRIAHLWTLRGGVVVRGEGYGDRGEALEVAGLEHPED
ncbi:MAG: nuclear transport factor 2 family protein [Solirubrobacterales bacterium]